MNGNGMNINMDETRATRKEIGPDRAASLHTRREMRTSGRK